MAEKQFGGWYQNPSQGGKTMRWWGGDSWTTGEDPTGGRGINWQQSQPTQSSALTSQPASQSTPDYTAIAKQQLQLAQEANKPAIASMEASIPEIQAATQSSKAALEASKAPLTERYQAIIDQLKGREQKETLAQQTALSQEYGKRGVPLSSGMFTQDLLGKTQNISQYYGGLQKETEASRSADLQDIATKISQLPIEETEKIRAVRNAIAQLQSGASSSAITNALDLYKNTISENRLQQAQALAEKQYSEVTLPESKATIANKGKSSSSDLSALLSILGGGLLPESQTTETEPQYSTSEGSYSKGGQWIFTGGQWYKVVE